MLQRWDESSARAAQRHEELLERGRADSRMFIAAMSDFRQSIQRRNKRLDEIAVSIRASTCATCCGSPVQQRSRLT